MDYASVINFGQLEIMDDPTSFTKYYAFPCLSVVVSNPIYINN